MQKHSLHFPLNIRMLTLNHYVKNIHMCGFIHYITYAFKNNLLHFYISKIVLK